MIKEDNIYIEIIEIILFIFSILLCVWIAGALVQGIDNSPTFFEFIGSVFKFIYKLLINLI